MMQHAIVVNMFASLLFGTFAHPRLTQDVSGARLLLEEPEMTECPDPIDMSFCLFEFLYNEACFKGTEEFNKRCQNLCTGLC
ncbi:hypothetical protein AWC38_SpisGene14157 [Stylophora pistillata]|uniref:ShKT domain-containing protein n=1 Tax=Stylophora pistillata TaxID=50429 RepID=A0A2B4RXS3_STYPI|nr:hypothetical protein AWC38_SpisGene14157 [Stylophora pistillata]